MKYGSPYGRGALLRDRMAGRPPHDRSMGSVLMEFLLVFPIIFLLVLSLLQFAQIWIARQSTAYAAYCAARATLCSHPDEDEKWAENAVKTACSWMCLAGLSTDDAETLEEVDHDSLNWNNYHDLTDEVADDDKIYRDVSAPRTNEQNIPGWGSVPGSSSRKRRVTVTPLTEQDVGEFATGVRVEFKFPLIFPLAGRIISWAANHPESGRSTYDHETGTWTGDAYYSVHTGWHDGKEVVMNDDGSLVNRSFAAYGEDGKYPVITLTETCILPCPYKRTNFHSDRYEEY